MEEKRVHYKNNEISVSFAPEVCIHAAECVRGLPRVFNTAKKPWINVNAEPIGRIVETIKKCPSGALKYELLNEYDKNEKENSMEKTKITVMPNGPIMVEGNLTVNKMSGENIKDAEKLFLCRCGHSANKPFCDGSHKKVEFTAE